MTPKDDVQDKLSATIGLICSRSVGVVDSAFLCQSIGTLGLKEPITATPETSLAAVLKILQDCKIGCLLIVDPEKGLQGIFSERDFVLKVADRYQDLKERPISEFMTADPVTQAPDTSVAYTLNLMSHGGFRHVPIVGDAGEVIALVSVKDLVDHLVHKLTDDLLNFDMS